MSTTAGRVLRHILEVPHPLAQRIEDAADATGSSVERVLNVIIIHGLSAVEDLQPPRPHDVTRPAPDRTDEPQPPAYGATGYAKGESP